MSYGRMIRTSARPHRAVKATAVSSYWFVTMSSTSGLRFCPSFVGPVRGLVGVSLVGERLLSHGRTLALADESLTSRGGLLGGSKLVCQLVELPGDSGQDRRHGEGGIAVLLLGVFLLVLRVLFVLVVLGVFVLLVVLVVLGFLALVLAVLDVLTVLGVFHCLAPDALVMLRREVLLYQDAVDALVLAFADVADLAPGEPPAAPRGHD